MDVKKLPTLLTEIGNFKVYCTTVLKLDSFICKTFLSRVSILTHVVDIVNLSVRPSVCP